MDKANEHFSAIRVILEGLKTDIEAATKKLTTTLNRTHEADISLQELDKKVEDKRKEVAEELQKLEEKAAPLRLEVKKLTGEIGVLVDRKTRLKKDTLDIEQKNREFKAYESRAWKELQAKDDDLVAREKSLQQREALHPKATSFLPEK